MNAPVMAGPGGRVTLAHGGGGRAMQQLIRNVLLPALGDPERDGREDQARLALDAEAGSTLAFTSDSFVVDPLFFAGGDIGALAVHGTINDLAVGGARPMALSCSLILEEGLEIDVLRRVVESMGRCARAAGVPIVTGDTKVVARGAADRMFVNTSGIGLIPPGRVLSGEQVRAGDVVLMNGQLGDHGAAVLCARGEMAIDSELRSDSRPLHRLTEALLQACPGVRCMRDATRGGVASVLHELAENAGLSVRLQEQALPTGEKTRGVCELLGLDPLYLANEGVLVAIVAPEQAGAALEVLRSHPDAAGGARIGQVVAEGSARVVIETQLGGVRVLDLLSGEQLPRIC